MQPTNPNEASTVRQTQISDVYPALHKEIERPGQILDESARVTSLRARPERRKLYIPVKGKFIISTGFACVWISVSWFLAQHWLAELAQVVGEMPAAVIGFFIALLPGFLNAHILSSVILDHPPKLRLDMKFPKISLLIAAYNEEENISETIRGIKNQDYRRRSRSSSWTTAPATIPSHCLARSIYPISKLFGRTMAEKREPSTKGCNM